MEHINLLIIVLILWLLFVYNSTSKLEEDVKIPKVTDLNEYYDDIFLEPYGCFTNMKDKFFTKKINPYSKLKIYDSGIFLSDKQEEIIDLIKRVIKNGYDIYGHGIMNKYHGKNYNDITIQELAVLGKLAGYNYISVYKTYQNERAKVLFTYSPPMDVSLPEKYTKAEYEKNLSKSDLPGYVLTANKDAYTNDRDRTPGKELSCGYPCSTKPEKDNKVYMCGSVAYPDIKTPPRYSVYHIAEKK